MVIAAGVDPQRHAAEDEVGTDAAAQAEHAENRLAELLGPDFEVEVLALLVEGHEAGQILGVLRDLAPFLERLVLVGGGGGGGRLLPLLGFGGGGLADPAGAEQQGECESRDPERVRAGHHGSSWSMGNRVAEVPASLGEPAGCFEGCATGAAFRCTKPPIFRPKRGDHASHGRLGVTHRFTPGSPYPAPIAARFVMLRAATRWAERLMIGELLGHYRLLEPLGTGGMGVVYRARDERTHRDVAVKVLHAGALADPEERRRFRREAAALSRLSHPNVTTLLDFDTHEGVDFIVMEKLEGESLAHRMGLEPLDEPTIFAYAIAIVEALEVAHRDGIVHRDLKPSNLQITPDGIKVVDFGLAKLDTTRSRALSVDLSMIAPGGGTLRYMAPELVLGGEADARSDLYSLGCILFEMATGRVPFDAATAGALVQQIVSRPARLPR